MYTRKAGTSTPYTSSNVEAPTTGAPSKGAHAQSKNLPGEPKAMLLLLRSNFCTHLLEGKSDRARGSGSRARVAAAAAAAAAAVVVVRVEVRVRVQERSGRLRA